MATLPSTDFDADDFVASVTNAPDTNTDDPFGDAPAPKDNEILSADEKRKAIDAWNSGVSDLKALIQAACGDGYDGRSKKGMAIKKFLADQNLKARPAQVYVKKSNQVVLSEANKEFIANNAGAMKPLEMTKAIFDDGMLTPLSSEFRVVKEYYDSLDNKVKAQSDDENVKDYNPPKNETQALARINRYVFEALDPTRLTKHNKDCIQKLIRFMHTHRYLFQMNSLKLNSERELFESSFVRFVYDKPDLTEEEIDLYINQCSDLIEWERMNKEMIELTEASRATREEEQKIPMALVEAIGKLGGRMDENRKRQKATLNDLNGKRANRLDKIQSNSESVLKLVEACLEEQSRIRVLALMEKRKDEVRKEADRLEGLDDLEFQLFGGTKEEFAS